MVDKSCQPPPLTTKQSPGEPMKRLKMGFVKGLEIKPPLLLQKQEGREVKGWDRGVYRASDWLPSDQGAHRGARIHFGGYGYVGYIF